MSLQKNRMNDLFLPFSSKLDVFVLDASERSLPRSSGSHLEKPRIHFNLSNECRKGECLLVELLCELQNVAPRSNGNPNVSSSPRFHVISVICRVIESKPLENGQYAVIGRILDIRDSDAQILRSFGLLVVGGKPPSLHGQRQKETADRAIQYGG